MGKFGHIPEYDESESKQDMIAILIYSSLVDID
jgi:hypothetical protein